MKLLATFVLVSLSLSPAITAIGKLNCPRLSPDEKLFTDTGKCYSFQERRGTSVTFDEAVLLCKQLGHGKRLASVISPEEGAFIADEMKRLGWNKIAISPRYLQTAWKWTVDDTFLRGQGCYRIPTHDNKVDDEVSSKMQHMNVIKCVETCDGQLFASLQGTQFCHCSSAEFLWPTRSSDCWLPCPDGSGPESCGGPFSRYTYATAEDVYDNWAQGRPSLGGECAAITIDHNTNRWMDTSCNLALPFICKFSNNNKLKIPVPAERIACSPTACYRLYTNPKMTWFDADKFCARYGGRLAKIESIDRQDLINTMLYDLGRGRHNNNAKIQEQIDDEQLSPSPAFNQAWIGATNHGWYDFADNNATLYAVHRSWQSAGGQPEMPGINSCTLFTVLPSGNGWQTANCNNAVDGGRFLCVSQAVNDDIDN